MEITALDEQADTRVLMRVGESGLRASRKRGLVSFVEFS
jgi:hypothetical protein